MRKEEVRTLFDDKASGYDRQWAKTAPIGDCLHFLLDAVFAELPSDARILCVGAGTGRDLLHLASVFPGWRFTAVDPSGNMLNECRRKAEDAGVESRCRFHEGYLDSLPGDESFDAATCFLVSQFILDPEERAGFFRSIAARLRAGGLLASSDLATDMTSERFDPLLRMWLHAVSAEDRSTEGMETMRTTYSRDVAVLPPARVEAIIEAGGFEKPVQFYQAGLIRGWFARLGSSAG